LKESENDPPRTGDTGEDLSVVPELRPGDGDPLGTYPCGEIPYAGRATDWVDPGVDGHWYDPVRCGDGRQRNDELLV